MNITLKQKKITFAYSPCPNDTFMFAAIAKKDTTLDKYQIIPKLYDIETLNENALKGTYDVTKLSFHTLLKASDKYKLLNVGSALGYGYGPLLLGRQAFDKDALENLSVAVPGELTTANLLLNLYAPKLTKKIFMQYNDVMCAVLDKKTDCALIIHESRFTYKKLGLYKIVDLGAWWEASTTLPIPLGGIAIKKTFSDEFTLSFENLLRKSIKLSQNNSKKYITYIKKHAQEMKTHIIDMHINAFVNDFSFDLGDTGLKAIEKLKEKFIEYNNICNIH